MASGRGSPMPLVMRVAVAHAVACLSGGVFVALAFAALQGVLINVLTGHAFRRISPWVQMGSMALLITVLFLTPFRLLGAENAY